MLSIFPLFITTTYLISSLILNFFQLCIYLFIRPRSIGLYRALNYYLMYSSCSQMVGVTEWFANCKVRIYASEEDWNEFGKDHAIVIMNHKYEVDWLYSWIIADKLKILAGTKSFAKKALRKIPIIGWSWFFSEMIFMERSWEKDSATLTQKLDTIMEYRDTKCLILLFAEGTRYTEEKFNASVEFARENSLPQLKHHLQPRKKGFNLCVKHLKGKMPAIYNVQIAFPKDEVVSFKRILWGHQLVGDVYIKKYNVSDIPVDSDKECTQFLYDMYQEKDQLMDEYLKTGKFPGEGRILQRRIWGLLHWGFWALVTGGPILYVLIFKVLLSGNSTLIAIAATSIVLVAALLHMLLGVTQAKKGSAYGSTSRINKPITANTQDNEAHADNREIK